MLITKDLVNVMMRSFGRKVSFYLSLRSRWVIITLCRRLLVDKGQPTMQPTCPVFIFGTILVIFVAVVAVVAVVVMILLL